jgi:hypothetical protein
VPKTIENCRIKDETYINDLQNDPELQLDLRTDEISKHLLKGPNKKDDEETEEDDDEFKKIDQTEYDSKVDKDEEEDKVEEIEDSKHKKAESNVIDFNFFKLYQNQKHHYRQHYKKN